MAVRPVVSTARPLGRSHKLKCLAVVRHDIVFRATGHFFLQAVPLDGIELLLGEQREALGIAHLRHGIVGALGEGDRVATFGAWTYLKNSSASGERSGLLTVEVISIHVKPPLPSIGPSSGVMERICG